MLADIVLWADNNFVLVLGGAGIFILLIVVSAVIKRKLAAPLKVSSAFEESIDDLSPVKDFQRVHDVPTTRPTTLAGFAAAEQTGSAVGSALFPVSDDIITPQQDEHKFNPAANHDHARQLIQSIQGDPPRRHLSVFYVMGMAVVAITLLLLPLIYIAIVVGVGYGVVLYAVDMRGVFTSYSSTRLAAIVYCGPIIVGAIMFLFLLKPLFARRAKAARPLIITEAEQPVLFAFIQELCLTLRAPFPKKVSVICDANAAASFRHQLWSLFRRGDVVLIIGLPLAAGLDLQSFTGVLAHEFGHFTQGTAMRLNAVIRIVNRWFARLVYENDSWDEGMDSAISSAPTSAAMIFGIAKLAIWVGRGILWCLMMVAQAMSCFLMRQQEFDADRYGTYISGSRNFPETLAKIMDLSIAESGAYKDLGSGLEKMTLPKDFVGLCLHNQSQISPEMKAKFRAKIGHGKQGLFDTHPSNAVRTLAAERLNMPGIFHPEQVPASVLFRNFEVLCEQATLNFYQSALGPLVDARITVPLPDFLEKIEIMNKGLRKKW